MAGADNASHEKTASSLTVNATLPRNSQLVILGKRFHTQQTQTHARTVLTQGPDLQNILRQSYDCQNLRSTYDGRLIYKTSYAGRKAFLMYDSLAKL